MQNFKERLFNYEVTPPREVWDNISAELDGEEAKRSVHGLRRRSKFIFYGLTAAASLIIIFISSLFFNRTGDHINSKNIAPAQADNLAAERVKDSINLNNKTLEAIIQSSKGKKQPATASVSSEAKVKKYITIEGPEGQPVKISPKVATLIVSADNQFPPRPVWDKKIEKWKQLMLSTTFSLTSTSLFDIAQLSATLDNNE